MFRIVTEFVPEPAFLAICSHSHCGQFMTAKASEMGAELPQQQAAFVAQLQINGWSVALDAIYCASHVAQAREQKKLIQLPRVTLIGTNGRN